MAFDAHPNLASSVIATAPSPANSGTSATIQTGDGTNFGSPANALVWPSGTVPLKSNSEIVRITGISGDVLTITRAQEGSSARSILVGDQIAIVPTAKVFTDIEALVGSGSGYSTIDQNAVALTARATLNIVSREAVAQDNAGATRTDLLIADYKTMLAERDHFISGGTSSGAVGKLNWAASSTVAQLNPVAGHPGLFQIGTGAVSGTFGYCYIRPSTAAFFANELFDIVIVGRLDTNDANTTIRFGAMDGVGGTPSNGIYIEKLDADTQWFGNNRNGSASNRTAALATCDTSFHTFRIRRINSTTAGFTVDGGAEVTLTTGIPGAVGVFLAFQIVNSTTVTKQFTIDLADLVILGLANS